MTPLVRDSGTRRIAVRVAGRRFGSRAPCEFQRDEDVGGGWGKCGSEGQRRPYRPRSHGVFTTDTGTLGTTPKPLMDLLQKGAHYNPRRTQLVTV